MTATRFQVRCRQYASSLVPSSTSRSARFAERRAAGLSFAAIGWHLAAGLVGLFIGFTLFALGYIGGGDAKLFAAVALWLGFKDLLPYALLASVFGGVLTLALILLRQCPLPQFLAHQAWIAKLHDARSGVPYGVALAVGAFVQLPSTEIFRLAAAA